MIHYKEIQVYDLWCTEDLYRKIPRSYHPKIGIVALPDVCSYEKDTRIV